MTASMDDPSSITFIDGHSGETGWASVRIVGDHVGLAVSLEHDGDIEVFLGRKDVEALARALLGAAADL